MRVVKNVRLPYVAHRITLTGLNLERFMNTMQKAGVPLLRVRRRDVRTLECMCYSADLAQIRELAQQKGWRIQSESPAQLSAAWAWVKKRLGVPVGVVLAVVLAVVLSQYVWRVEIFGAGAYRADIAAYIAEEVRPGTPRSRLDAAELEARLTRRYPEIAWFHVYVYNVTLVVDVTQGVPMPELPSGQPGDVVATRGGVVDSVRVFAGTALVRAGDVVTKGQVLIQGTERAADEQTVAVRAEGVVMARCWRSHTVHMPLYEVQSTETGRETVRVTLQTPWVSWPQALDAPPYLACNTYYEDVPVAGCFFPVWQRRVLQREVAMEYRPRDEAQVRTEAADAAFEKLKTALRGYEIVDKWVEYCMIEGDTLAATATAEWLMDIGGQAPP